HTSPARTARIACITVAAEADFGTKPDAPCAMTRAAIPGPARPDTTTTGTPGWAAHACSTAPNPCASDRSRSSNTMSIGMPACYRYQTLAVEQRRLLFLQIPPDGGVPFQADGDFVCMA